MTPPAATRQETYLPAPVEGHDPRWWLLDGRAGWRVMAPLDPPNPTFPAAEAERVLTLPHAAGVDRALTEPIGGFGGLTMPSHLAVDADGTLYLLDRDAARLKRFDPCACAFETLPCLAGFGEGARQVRSPNGIGIHGG